MSTLRRVAATTLAAAVSFGSLVAVASSASADDATPTYYVSLGDSLSTGYQPGAPAGEDPDHPEIAYTGRLYEKLKESDPNLVHKNFGCDGATAHSVLTGAHPTGQVPTNCTYTNDTQLADAVQFLKDHRGQVTYVSVGIGANDVQSCVTVGSGDDDLLTCLTKRIKSVGVDLAAIDAAVREAGGAKPRYVGMTYYNPFLAGYVSPDPNMQALAGVSGGAANMLNDTITTANKAHGFLTADVAGAFSSNDTTLVDLTLGGQQLKVQRNVERICTWTWMCLKSDIHANPTGHQKIADAFVKVLTAKPPVVKPPVTTPPKPVAKATTSTRAKLVGKHRISTRKHARVRVRVRAARHVAPGGTLVVKDGKRTLKRVHVGRTGKRTVRLPRLKRGTHRITVLYKGSKTTKPSKSNRIKIIVRRR